MLDVSLGRDGRPVERVLAIGSHPDDIEIGCGGTLLALTHARPEVSVTWVVLTGAGERAAEAEASAGAFLARVASTDVRLHAFRDGFLPSVGGEVKDVFEGLKDVRPDLVFTHTREDLHQDHRLACELTWNTFRDHLILEYEVPKYDGDLGARNVFVPLAEDLVAEKLQLLSSHHGSQHAKHWFDGGLFRGLMRIRGMECASPYAEAFTCRKLPLTFE
jgi:LmbE family N-acetylglucosaminyl deacetylase